jgi:DUF4097 and DUF4098 domain-containing protein YvlB
MMYEFDCPEPITLSLRVAGGSAEIIAGDRTNATVEVSPFDGSEASRNAAARTRVELRDGGLVVEAPEWTGLLFRRGPRVRVRIHLPQDGELNVTVASAEVRAAGRYRTANINSASGDVTIEHVTGDGRVGRVDGDLRITAASGDFVVGRVGGEVSAHSASGDIAVERVGGSLKATTASGDIQVGAATTGAVQVKSASGDVSIGVVPGTGVWLDLATVSGDTHTDLAMPQAAGAPGAAGEQSAATLTLQVRTVSGDIDVHRAQERAAA